jgi:hypothetical protein
VPALRGAHSRVPALGPAHVCVSALSTEAQVM